MVRNPKARYLATPRFGVLCACLAISSLLGCRCREETPVRLKAVNPAYLGVYSVSKASDDSHTVEMTGPQGATWYREPVAAFDLSHFQFDQARPAKDRDGHYAVDLEARPSEYNRLASWSREHVNTHIGFVLEGRLVAVAELEAELRTGIRLPGLVDRKQAEWVLEAIKGGGLYEGMPASAPATQLVQPDSR